MGADAREDLAMIRRLMEESRREARERGRHLMIWGGLSAVGLTATYLSALGRLPVSVDALWVVLLLAGWSASMMVGWRDARRAEVRTLGRRLLSVTWVAVGVTLTVIAAAGLFGPVVSAPALGGLVAVVIAPAVLVTAVLTGERWLSLVAAGWWLGGGVMLFVPGLYSVPLMAAMSLLLLAVPGGVLNARSRRARGEGAAAGVG